MDNITHGLIGFALAQVVAEQRQATVAKSRALICGAVLSSNLPDLDLVFSAFASDRKLLYLLHHRGYTHTLLWVLPLSALAAWLGAKLMRFKPTAGERWELLSAASLGGLLHILFDSFNNYGVHPFYPFDNSWHYGDTLFIVEPWLFGPLLVLLIFSTRLRWVRFVAVASALGFAVWLLSMQAAGKIDASVALSCMLCGAALQALAHWKFPRRASLLALAGVALVVGIFAAGGALATSRLRAELRKLEPELVPLEIVKTPTPGNPLCWNVLAVERVARELRVLRGVVALVPSWFAPDVCRFPAQQAATALPTSAPRRVQPAPESGVLFDAEYGSSLEALRSAYFGNCRARAFFQFARVPFLAPSAPTASANQRSADVLGDLRYDTSAGLGFAEIELDAVPPAACPRWLPPWQPPRSELVHDWNAR